MTGKLKVGLVTPALYWGGAERVFVNLARTLRDRVSFTGCAMCCPAYREANMVAEMSRYIPVFPAEPDATADMYGVTAVRQVADAADVLICWGDTPSFIAWSGFTGPVVYIAHGCGEWDQASAKQAAASGVVTHWVGVSSACAAVLPHDFTIIENGVEPARCLATRSRAEVRKELGLLPTDFAVGYLGRMAREKDPTRIATALSIMPKQFKGVWIGGGYDCPSIRRDIYCLLGNRAVFRDTVWQIGDYLQCFDIFALVSPAEGFSMAFLEACLAGVPCVTTPVGVMPDLERRHGKHWGSIPVDATAEKLAQEIYHAALLPTFVKRRAERAQKVVAEHYLDSHTAEKWLMFLESITEVEAS